MDFNIWRFILDTLEAAGVIGGYVSISIISVSLITYASRGKLSGNKLIGSSGFHPIIGALLGLIPGCGATIVVSSMYKNNKISFGGLLAAFIATLGEGSFVLLGASDEASVSANLQAFLIVNLVGASVAVLSGYLVDSLGISIPVREVSENVMQHGHHKSGALSLSQIIVDYIGFYLILAFSAFMLPGSLMALWGGNLSGYDSLFDRSAILITIISIIYYLFYKFTYIEHDCSHDNGFRASLEHAVSDISTVIVYVFAGLLIANYTIDILVGPATFDAWMASSAFVVVAVAGIIGATPGCGGMISVAVAYLAIPNFPIAALITAGIATSGDGIFPLLVSNRKAALVITALGLVVSLMVGYGALAIGIRI
ncbi:putative manganese transporter [Alkalibacterium kapii]|uniref:Membrane protein n=1 Tax=Alkalibacterium kapii TaxID=426704 RepID=A0A511AYN3_9LACT|nr:putative manganese transporter [Alkalibacterium kapii]GEK90717.1 membrane protein [Alkalibacterium kapii]